MRSRWTPSPDDSVLRDDWFQTEATSYAQAKALMLVLDEMDQVTDLYPRLLWERPRSRRVYEAASYT